MNDEFIEWLALLAVVAIPVILFVGSVLVIAAAIKWIIL